MENKYSENILEKISVEKICVNVTIHETFLFCRKDTFKLIQKENIEYKWSTCTLEGKKIQRNPSIFVRESKKNIYD